MSNYAFQFDGHGTFTPDGRTDSIGDVAAHNAEVEQQELAIWAEQPERWQVYVSAPLRNPQITASDVLGGQVTTWTGFPLGRITKVRVFMNNLGKRITAIRFRGTNGAEYYGRYGADWSELCRVRKVKGAGK